MVNVWLPLGRRKPRSNLSDKKDHSRRILGVTQKPLEVMDPLLNIPSGHKVEMDCKEPARETVGKVNKLMFGTRIIRKVSFFLRTRKSMARKKGL